MRSLPVVAVVVIATATLSLTGVPLAAGSAIPTTINDRAVHVRDVSEAPEIPGGQGTLIKRVHHVAEEHNIPS